jgi:hypothetical protein
MIYGDFAALDAGPCIPRMALLMAPPHAIFAV